MDEIKEGDIVWAVRRRNDLISGKLPVIIRHIYPSSVSDSTYFVERYPDLDRSWYTERQNLMPLTPEEKLELTTFGKILEVD